MAMLLRFRDFSSDTIAEHTQLLARHGHVWWGWWKKDSEPDRTQELAQLAASLQDRPVIIGLFDRSTDRFFTASLDSCEFAEVGRLLRSPEPGITPEYYREESVPAWFRFITLDRVSRQEFVDRFGGVPLGHNTCFVTDNLPQSAEPEPVIVTSFTFVHLSDIHFGRDFGYPHQTGPQRRPLLDILVRDLRSCCPDGVAFIVVTGDLSSRGDANVLFDPALPFLRELADRLGLEENHFVLVPGNHDIPLSDYSHLTYGHESAYQAFVSRFYGHDVDALRSTRFVFPDDRTIDLLSVNSVRLRSEALSQFGYCEWPLYEEFLDQLGPCRGAGMRVAALHHHLVPTLREESVDEEYPRASVSLTLDSGAVLEGLQKHDFGIALHGHHHVPQVTRVARGRRGDSGTTIEGLEDSLYVVAAGSAGVRGNRLSPEMPHNSYNIFTLGEQNVRMRVRKYTQAGRPEDHFRVNLPI